jgi:uncharacterized protein YdhG (YjbR/CyaY superfamily)
MANQPKFKSQEDYIAAAPQDAQTILLAVQSVVESALPDAQRCISYNMPAYRYHKTFFYFAVFKLHLGIYPPVTEDPILIAELMPYRNAKGNLSFPLNKPIPHKLIGRVAVALAKQYAL